MEEKNLKENLKESAVLFINLETEEQREPSVKLPNKKCCHVQVSRLFPYCSILLITLFKEQTKYKTFFRYKSTSTEMVTQ